MSTSVRQEWEDWWLLASGKSALSSTDKRFISFHVNNPQVYNELVRLAREAKAAGRSKIGVRMIWEVTRWNLTIGAKDPDSEFKLNDHYHSRYARLIMMVECDLRGIFEVRSLKS